MLRKIGLQIPFLILSFALTAAAHAADFDQYCNLPGFAAPLRQTIVVLDESQIYPEVGDQIDQRNMPWRNFLGNLLLSNQSALEQAFLPRERISIVIARRDGTGLHFVFSGCLPFYSPQEKKRIEQSAGYSQLVDKFFGTGPIANAEKDRDTFRRQFDDAVHDALQPPLLSPPNAPRNGGDLASAGLIESLKQGALVNLDYGIPRIIFFSDMSRLLKGAPSERSKARSFAISKAQDADLNLKDAEVYVVGISENAMTRDTLEMFFLASHGELVSVGSASAIPTFASAPVHVVFYQGLLRYPDRSAPMRLRLATDQNGTVVNSWLSAQAITEQFSPIHGVVTCQSSQCTFTGDGVFAQVWNVNRGQGRDSDFDRSMSFAGARNLTFVESGNTVAGAISDPQVQFQNLDPQGHNLQSLRFSASRQPNAHF